MTLRTQTRPDYLFIHTVRFWSMAAIVCMHAAEKIARYQPLDRTEMYLLIQPFKFGTIGFFLISGFLLGDRLPSSKPLVYLRRRANRLIPAWLVWYGFEVLLGPLKAVHGRSPRIFGFSLVVHSMWSAAVTGLLDSAFWFVPNFIVALTCLVLLRRWLNDLRLGAVLLAVSLAYGANVYFNWIPSRHTEALFAFVFYLWLGAWCAQRKEQFERWLRSIPVILLVVSGLAAMFVAQWESSILMARSSVDPLNTLRFGNQLYAVVMTLLLLRIRRRTWPAFVDVGQTTYGIYLAHSLSIAIVFALGASAMPLHTLGPAGLAAVVAILAATAYFLTFYLVRWVASSAQYSWVVGAANFNAPPWFGRLKGGDEPLAYPRQA